MKLKELMAGITPGKLYVGTPIRSSDTLGINVLHEDGGESHEETIAEVMPSSKDGQQKSDAAYLTHCANHFPALVKALESAVDFVELGADDSEEAGYPTRAQAMRENAVAYRKILAAAQEVEV